MGPASAPAPLGHGEALAGKAPFGVYRQQPRRPRSAEMEPNVGAGAALALIIDGEMEPLPGEGREVS